MTIKPKAVIVFDLDDTLINEYDFLESAYSAIAQHLAPNDHSLKKTMLSKYHSGENVFEYLTQHFKVSLTALLAMYRSHIPNIKAKPGVLNLLTKLKNQQHLLGLITDGRSLTQRNKLKAANLEHFFEKIIVSEEFGSQKPQANNYLAFTESAATQYFYIGDNLKKDFITPNSLGWETICMLDNGLNIHPQDFNTEKKYLAKHVAKDIEELSSLLYKLTSQRTRRP